MKQISNEKKSLSYLYYFFFGLYIAIEPFYLVRLFNTYLPDFYYRGLTVSISVVLGIVGFQKMRAATPLPNISQVYIAAYQVPKLRLKPKFWKNVLKSSKRFSRDLINSFKSSNSKEPTVEIHRKESLIATRLAVMSSILAFTSLPYLFVTNLSDFGLFETSLKIFVYSYIILIYVLLCIKQVSVSTIKQNNGIKSGEDLDEVLYYLRSKLEDWHFEGRVVLNSNLKTKKGDIDIVAISPDSIDFLIELKSHVGDVFWNSKSKELRRQFGKNLEPVLFEKDFFNQLHGQAKTFIKSNKRQNKPQKILLFWRATVKINTNDRLKRGVLISNKKLIIDDLRERNNDLSN